MSEVRVRFAPSPTGYLHIGSLRTALYNYIYAKQQKGKFIIRVEDTDRTRIVETAIENLIDSLAWAGIEHDEGVFLDKDSNKTIQKGEYGPYIQSERLDIYKKHIDELLKKEKAYYCFCSKERIEKVRDQQKEKGETPKYDGHCKGLDDEEVQRRLAVGEQHVIRLSLPTESDISFDDAVRGTVTINTKDMDDQVLIKADGFPTYHFAVVVDDYLMEITHVVRGEEWLTSTPKHVYLFKAFGWEAPQYIHLPTVLNKDKKKLSKRQGDVAVGDFKNKGYLPEAMVNYLALVGWSPNNNQELFSIDDLIEQFSFERVSKTGGIFDIDKLNWINGQYIKSSSPERITDLAIPYLKNAGYITDADVEGRYEWIVTMVKSVQEKVSLISEIPQKVSFFFADELEFESEKAKQVLEGEQVSALCDAFINELNSIDEVDDEFTATIFKKIQKQTGVKGKSLFMPIRVMVTGQQHGPDIGGVLKVLGKENILKRVKYVKENIAQ
ncbi:glutamate--tRNA ligase [Proteinivorax hydrogeniformans]|uniref:Glutamate--tRNA ligase n=1 Tax=Proteinivorax hydrogeniformans TaxID=1826727 RepID=A0AAU8HSU7_9FIRM